MQFSKAVTIPLLLCKGKLHNWQAKNSVRVQNMVFMVLKPHGFSIEPHRKRRALLSSYFSCKKEQSCFLARNNSYTVWLLETYFFKDDLLNKETRV